MSDSRPRPSTGSRSACGPSAPGRDPFGDRPARRSTRSRSSRRLAELGAYGVCFHDDDLIPFDATPSERERIVARFRKALDETGLKVPMATTNLVHHPVFKDGAFTANDRDVRRYAHRARRCAHRPRRRARRRDLRLLGRPRGRRDRRRQAGAGTRSSATARRSTSSAATCATRATTMRFALEPKPNEPRGDIFLPTVGHALHFIERLSTPTWSASTPRSRTRRWPGSRSCTRVAQALWAGKLFHIDLNSQRIGRYDQDFRFGAGGPEGDLLPRRAARGGRLRRARGTSTPSRCARGRRRASGTSPRGCMRTYLILARARARVRRRPARRRRRCAAAGVPGARPGRPVGPYSPEAAERAAGGGVRPRRAGRARACANERLDQLAVDHLLGAA